MIKNIGIVGTGEIATQFVSQIDRNKYKIKAVYNRNPESLFRFTDVHKLKNGYSDYHDFLENGEIDCVYIATPNQTHYDLVLKALEAKKHVLCEKVMVLNKKEVTHLYEVAEKNDVILLEAVTLFYMPLYDKIQQLLADNILGKLSGVNVTFGSCKEYDPDNRFFSLEKGGGALFDIGTYALSAAVYLLGTDLKMVATDVVMTETGVDEKSTTILRNSNNQLASVMISFRGKMPKQIILTGDKGYLIVDDFPRAEEATVYLNNGHTKQLKFGNGRDVFTYELDAMNAYEKKEPIIDIREVTKSVISIMDDMRHSWGWHHFD